MCCALKREGFPRLLLFMLRHVAEIHDDGVQVGVTQRAFVEAVHFHVGPCADRTRVANVLLQRPRLEVLGRVVRYVEVRSHRGIARAVHLVAGEALRDENCLPCADRRRCEHVVTDGQLRPSVGGRLRDADRIDLVRPLLAADFRCRWIGPHDIERTDVIVAVQARPRCVLRFDCGPRFGVQLGCLASKSSEAGRCVTKPLVPVIRSSVPSGSRVMQSSVRKGTARYVIAPMEADVALDPNGLDARARAVHRS